MQRDRARFLSSKVSKLYGATKGKARSVLSSPLLPLYIASDCCLDLDPFNYCTRLRQDEMMRQRASDIRSVQPHSSGKKLAVLHRRHGPFLP